MQRMRATGRRLKLYVRETRYATWVVREEGNRRGGCFFTYEAALKFIRNEFGPDARPIMTYLAQKVAA